MNAYTASTYGDRIADVYDEIYRWADWRRSPFTSQSRSHVSVYERVDFGA